MEKLVYGSGKAWKTQGIFFLLLCGHPEKALGIFRELITRRRRTTTTTKVAFGTCLLGPEMYCITVML